MAEAKPAAVQPLELRQEGSSLVSGSLFVLTSLPAEASVRSEGGGAVILGFASPGGQPAARADFELGELRASRFLALGRTSLWWMTPCWGSSTQQVPEETQFLLAGLEGGAGFALLLPLIDGGAFRATLRPGSPKEGSQGVQLSLRIESGAADVAAASWTSALLVAAGSEPYSLIDQAVAAAARLSGTSKPRAEKEVPASANVFGYCTWDSFYSKVSAVGIDTGLKSLVEGGAPPRLLIIDDGWQRTDVDPQYRQTAAKGCISSDTPGEGLGMGSAIHTVEEAAAGLLGGPDNQMAEELQARHHIQSEEAEHQHPAQTQAAAAGKQPSTDGGSSSGVRGGLLAVIRACARSAYGSLTAAWARLLAAVFNAGHRLLDATPSDHWRMKLFSRLLSSRVLRPTLLGFYAALSDHTRRLVSIRANAKFASPSSGPEHALESEGSDLGAVVAALKQRYGVRYIYCWHAMPGFWGGLGLEDPEMARYKPQLVLPTPTPGILAVDPAVAWVQPVLSGVGLPEDPAALHQDLHAYLASCGVDGVKVDVQSVIGLLGSAPGRGGGPALSAAYHASLEGSARAHFRGNHLINCMCHSTEDLYRMEDTNLARVSDDFYPLREESHQSHIANCAYNSLFFGALVVPDWDMFHSRHPKALLHATARAISGGPVYVSDRPGHHDFALLRRMVLPDGSVLRCRLPGRPTADCLLADVSRDGATALKVWNANAVTGAVAVFNLQGASWDRRLRRFSTHDLAPPALTAAVGPADVPALVGAAETFAAYVDSTQELSLLAPGERLSVAVAGGGGSDLVTLSPVAEAGGVLFAPIGLPGMLNGGGAVLSCSFSGGHSDDGFEVQPARAALTLVPAAAGAALLCYASHRPASVAVGGKEVEYSYDAGRAALRFDLPAAGPAAEGGGPASLDATVQF